MIFHKRERGKKNLFYNIQPHTCTEDYIGLQTSRSNIDKKLISYNTRRDALFTMETGPVMGIVGIMEDSLGTEREGTSVCLIGWMPKHAVYLHISVQYIKYKWAVLSKKYFFFPFHHFFFKFPGLVKNLTA